MEKFTKIMSAAVLAAASLSLSGCQDEDFGFDAKEISYRKNFEAFFGKVNPDQDFNMASQYFVDVSNKGTSTVKIYAEQDGKYKIAAQYDNVSGNQKLYFDAPKGIERVLVTNGMNSEIVPVGATVTLGAQTRALLPAGVDGYAKIADGTNYGTPGSNPSRIQVSANTNTSSWLYFTPDQMGAYRDVVPESNTASAHANWGKVTQNYSMVGTGETYILYPMFWNTSQTNILGIYYYENNDRVMVPIYASKSGSEVRMYKQDNQQWYDVEEDMMGDHLLDAPTSYGNPSLFELRGINVTIPQGLQYGFYVTSSAGTFYSDASLNETATVDGVEMHIPHSCTFEYNGRTYYGFEDWATASTDGDMNDFDFIISGDHIVVDEESYKWILAYEDLGNTFDIDFNDAVIEIEHVSGQSKATVTPLAAGGTLSSWLYYGDTELGEIHYLLGAVEADAVSSTPSGQFPVTNADSRGTAGTPIEIDVDADFTMASYTSEKVSTAASAEITGKMGGFMLKVATAGSTTPSLAANYVESTVIQAPSGKSNVPQMFCLEYPFKSVGAGGTTYNVYWGWPTETTLITEAYSNFTTWVSSGKTQNTDWYKYPNSDNTVTTINVQLSEGGAAGSVTDGVRDPGLSLLSMTASSKRGSSEMDNVYTKSFADLTSVYMIPVNTKSDGAITYSSSDENVIRVDASGNLTFVGGGTASIEISQASNEYFTSAKIYLDITVSLAVQTIAVDNEGNLSIKQSQSFDMTPRSTSNKHTFSTDTPEIISITPKADGKSVTITGLKKGHASLTINAEGGATYGSATKTVYIDITADDPNLTVASTNVTVYKDQTFALNPSRTGSGVISYEYDENYISINENGVITGNAITNTPTVVKVKLAANGTYDSAEKEVTVSVEEYVSQNGQTFNLSLVDLHETNYMGWGTSSQVFQVEVPSYALNPGTTATIKVNSSTSIRSELYANNSNIGTGEKEGNFFVYKNIDATKFVGKKVDIVFWQPNDQESFTAPTEFTITFSE